MEGKKVAVAVVLITVTVAAFVVVAKRAGLVGKQPPMPKYVLDRKAPKVEMKAPYKVVTKTIGEWEALGRDADGRYKSPDSREYIMVDPMECASCKEFIPVVQYSASLNAMLPGPAQDEAMQKAQEEYKCPKCAKPAFPPRILPAEGIPPPR